MSVGGTRAYDALLDLPPLVRAAVDRAQEVGFAFSCLPSQGRLLQLLAGGVGEGEIGEPASWPLPSRHWPLLHGAARRRGQAARKCPGDPWTQLGGGTTDRPRLHRE